MASLPKITPSKSTTITLEPLSPSAFAPFGTVIVTPLAKNLNTIPPSIPPQQLPTNSLGKASTAQIQFANQNTAIKTSPVSPLINNYPDFNHDHPSRHPNGAANEQKSIGQVSIFSCFPRQNLHRNGHEIKLKVEILERHPFTTQTFCPFGTSTSNDKTDGGMTFWIVVVAKTTLSSSSSLLSSSTTTTTTTSAVEKVSNAIDSNKSTLTSDQNQTDPSDDDDDDVQNGSVTNPPDLSSIRAFIAPVPAGHDGVGSLAVTYAPGTWHAPMVVVGERRVDFLVSQFANGVSNDDCQEVRVGGGSGGRSNIDVDLSGLGLGYAHLWKRNNTITATGRRAVKL